MARKRHLQELVTTGRLTLPVVAIVVSLLWLIGSLSPIQETGYPLLSDSIPLLRQDSFWRDLIGCFLLGVTTIQLLMLHNTFALIRTRTDFYLTLYILLAGVFIPQTSDMACLLISCLLFTTHNLFKAYQRQQPVGYVFQGFMFIGLGSLAFPPLLYYVPFLYGSMGSFRALTARTFFAGLTGLCLPYWGLFTYAACTENMELFYAPFQHLLPVFPPDYGERTLPEILTLGYILLITIAGSLHCLVHNYEDKIRTRTYLTYFIVMQAWTLLLLFVLPQHFAIWLPLLILGCSIPAGHLFALSHSKTCNLFFVLCVILFIALIFYNVWMYMHNI